MLLNADLSVAEILSETIDGQVTTDADRRRTCTLTLENSDGRWSPDSAADAFFPNRLIRVDRGIYVNGSPEYVSLGIFLVDKPSVVVAGAGATLRVQGQDRLKLIAKSSFTKPVRYESGTHVGDVIRAIATDAGMGSTLYRIDDDGKTLGADRYYEIGSSRPDAIADLATSFHLDVFVDADGYLVVQAGLTDETVPAPVWAFERGSDAIMLGITRDLDDDRLYNHTLVSGEASDQSPISAEARDLNPASPSYNPVDGSGPIGDRLYTFTSAMIRSSDQAQEVADGLLFSTALIVEAISLPSVAHPAIEAGDVVTVNERVSRAAADYLIESVTMPLGRGPMTITSKRLRGLS